MTPRDSTETVIGSFDDYVRALKGLWTGTFLYRGEDSADYPLLSRWGRAQSVSEENTATVERDLFNAFRRHALPHCEIAPRTEWEWLALAQHHCVATRLLDWTENPLIAAYFAVRKTQPKVDRVVYVLDFTDLTTAREVNSPFEGVQVELYRPPHFARRVAAQGAVLTKHPIPSQVFTSSGLRRWVIAAAAISEMYVTRDSFGVNEASAFPDLDGVGRNLNIQYVRDG